MWDNVSNTNHGGLGFSVRPLRAPPRRTKIIAPSLRLKKVPARLRILTSHPLRDPKNDVPITFILNDFGLTEVRFFSPLNLSAETRVAIVISSPKVFYAHGRISWTYESNPDSRIIRDYDHCRYRSAIQLEFENETEKKQVAEFFAQTQKALHSSSPSV